MKLLAVLGISVAALFGCNPPSSSESADIEQVFSLAREGKVDDAIRLSEHIDVENDFERYQLLSVRARLLFDAGRFEEAEGAIKTALGITKERLGDSVLLAEVVLEQDKIFESITVLERAKEGLPPGQFDDVSQISHAVLNPDEERAFLMLSVLSSEVGKNNQALEVVEEGLLRNPGSVRLFERLISLAPEKKKEYFSVCPLLAEPSSHCSSPNGP